MSAPREPFHPFPAHFDGVRFFNPNAPQARGLADVLRWKLTSRPERDRTYFSDVRQTAPPLQVNGQGIRITYVNHSTLLLQQCGLNMLTDPIWSDRASPFQFAGPRRKRLPGVRWSDLPPIGTVLISHNHYDHLDLPTLRRIANAGGAEFFVPAKVGRLLASERIGPFRELDWGDSASLGAITVHCVPALHFSARSLFDRNRTLWCGYVVESPNGLIYFAGDTAFGDHFAAIRARFGAPGIALLPVGAYRPRWFMSPVHMGPDDAVRAARILEARTAIAIHHGTFQLGDDAVNTPSEELERMDQRNALRILRNGEFLDFE